MLQQSLLALAVCAPILVIASLGLPRIFTFPEPLVERLAFALRAGLVVVLWVVLGVRMVDGRVLLSGPATLVYSGEVALA